MLDSIALMPALLGAALGSAFVVVLGTFYLRRRLAALAAAHQLSLVALNEQHVEAMRVEREHLQKQHEHALQAAEHRYTERVEKIESPLTVLVHPFVNTSVDKGLFRNSSVVEVGYKYQLLVQGIPCFPAHDVVVERQTKVETDEAAIAAWSAKALVLAEAAAKIKGGGIASTLISVAKTVVQSRK